MLDVLALGVSLAAIGSTTVAALHALLDEGDDDASGHATEGRIEEDAP